MDVKIENKDILLCCNGDPFYVSGIEEIAQRVKIACSVRKGSFAYDRELGRYEADIDTQDDRLCDKLTMIFKEATVDIGYSDLVVTGVRKTATGIVAQVMITCNDKSITTEVTIDEYI